jgi:hypothetical protein
VAPAHTERSADDADAITRTLIASVIRGCTRSREQICEDMSARLGRPITPSSPFMLDDFTSLSKGDAKTKTPARFPAAWIEVFCQATNDDRLQMHVMGARKRRLIEFAKAELRATSDQRERDRLRHELLEEGGRP